MQNVRVIEFSSGVKSPPLLCLFSGEYLRPVDGRAEHILVSWLGKEAMAGVGLADSFNMVVMSFFAAIDLGTTVVVAFSPGKLDPEACPRSGQTVADDHDPLFDHPCGGYPLLRQRNYRLCRGRSDQ